MPKWIVIGLVAAGAFALLQFQSAETCRQSLTTMDKRILTGLHSPTQSDVEEKIARMCR